MRVLDDESDDSMEINILPMIDVIFAILAFFHHVDAVFDPI